MIFLEPSFSQYKSALGLETDYSFQIQKVFSLLCAVKLHPGHQQRAPSTLQAGTDAWKAEPCK